MLYSIVAGLLIGRLLGGRVGNLAHVRFVWWQLALAGLVTQAVVFYSPVQGVVGALGPVVYVVSTIAVLIALLRNLRLPGLVVIAAGAVLNLIPIVANGGYMPSSPRVWLELTGVAAVPVEGYTNVALIGPDTWFAFLGDIFMFPRPLPMATAFSLGDAVIAIGAILFLASAMRMKEQGRPTTPVTPDPQPVAR